MRQQEPDHRQNGTQAADKASTPTITPSGTSYSVTLLEADTVFAAWDGVAAMILAALNVGEMTLEQIKAGIADGTVAVVQMTKGDELTGIGTLQIIETQFRGDFRRMLNILTVTGHAVEKAREPFLEFCEAVATAHDCDGVMLKGRRGWRAKLRPFGFRTEYEVLARMFDNGR